MITSDADQLSLSDLSVSDDTRVGDLGDELQEGNPLWAKEAAWRLAQIGQPLTFSGSTLSTSDDVPTAATPEAKKAAKVLDYAGNATTVLGLENLSRLLLQSAKLEVSTEGGDGDIPKSATCEKSFHRSVEALSLTARTLRLIERRFCPCEHGNACGCLCAELQDDRWRKPSGQDVALKIDPKNFLRHAYFNSTHQVCASSREAGKGFARDCS